MDVWGGGGEGTKKKKENENNEIISEKTLNVPNLQFKILYLEEIFLTSEDGNKWLLLNFVPIGSSTILLKIEWINCTLLPHQEKD